DFEFIDFDDDHRNGNKTQQKKIIKKKDGWSSVSLSQVLENGIFIIEAEFTNTKGGWGGIGIVRDTYDIPANANPIDFPHNLHLAFLGGAYCGSGNIYYNEYITEGNIGFRDYQIIKLEFDSEQGNVTFFIEGKQQRVYISGIREKVRFFISMCHNRSTCIIHSLKKIASPTTGNVPFEKPV
ncbi:MAG: hypothetical protein EZS28_052865, partial [Streblomastix strix]